MLSEKQTESQEGKLKANLARVVKLSLNSEALERNGKEFPRELKKGNKEVMQLWCNWNNNFLVARGKRRLKC